MVWITLVPLCAPMHVDMYLANFITTCARTLANGKVTEYIKYLLLGIGLEYVVARAKI
jgi:hypothetical protein